MQAGSAAFDLLFVPVRMAVLLLVVALTLGLDFQADGILPSLVLLLCFVPFVWGLGLIAAAAVVTFRRGGGVIGVAMAMLGLASGAFFPLALLPGWVQTIAEANPVAIAIEGTREALIGGSGWSGIGHQRADPAAAVRPGGARGRGRVPRRARRASTGTGRWGCTDGVLALPPARLVLRQGSRPSGGAPRVTRRRESSNATLHLRAERIRRRFGPAWGPRRQIARRGPLVEQPATCMWAREEQ